MKCENGLLYLVSADELEFLKTEILEPQAERSVLWLAGQKLMSGLLANSVHIGYAQKTYTGRLMIFNFLELKFTWRLENNSNPAISSYTKWESPGPLQAAYHRDLCIAASYR